MNDQREDLTPFAEKQRCEEFGEALMRKLLARMTTLREGLIPPENVSNYPHGHGWKYKQQREDGFHPEVGEFQRQSTEVSIERSRVLGHDLALLDEFVHGFSDKMHEEFVSRLMLSMNDTCEQSGRTSNIEKGGSLVDGFLASIATLELSVGEDGEVDAPMIMLDSGTHEKLSTELAKREDAEAIKLKADEIRKEAEKQARKKDAERLAKFHKQ